MISKEEKKAVLYCRVKKSNKEWFEKRAKKLGYKRPCKYMDRVISEMKRRQAKKK